MERLLNDLAAHNYQNRAFALIENGSWAPQANKIMREKLTALKNMREIGGGVTLLSALKEKTKDELFSLADEIATDIKN